MATTIRYYQSVTFMGGAELQNPRIENQSSNPASGYIGQMYYNTQDSCLYVCYQTSPSVAWKKVGAGGAIVQADSSVTNPAINVASSSDSDGVTTYKLSVQGLANSNISNNAAIAWSKLATGTANRLTVTNGSGVLTTSPFTVGAGGTGVAGTINVAGYRVTNVADPIDGTDAINFSTLKAWFSGNVDIHEPCDVATTANIALTGTSVPTVIDGVDISTGGGSTMRVLVWNQTNATQNGIYDWVYNSSTGKATLTRSSDCNENTELYPGSTTYVIGGNTYASTGFVQKDQGSGVGGAIGIGSEANNWVENYSIAKINAGAGLTRVGNTISVNPNSTLAIDTNSKVGLATVTVTTTGSGASNTTPTLTVDDYGRVSAITYNAIKIAAGDITSGVLGRARGGTGIATVAKGDILYGSAANTWGRLAIGGTSYAGTILYNTGEVPEWKTLGDAGIASTGHTHQITNLQIGDAGLNSNLTRQFLRKQLSGAGSTSTPEWSYIDALDLFYCNSVGGVPVQDTTQNGLLVLEGGQGHWLTTDQPGSAHGALFLGIVSSTSGSTSPNQFSILDFDEYVAEYLTGLGTTGVVRVDNGTVSLGQVSLGSTTDVTGILPLANGGTGADLSSTSTYKQWGVVYRASATALSMTAAGTANRPLVGNGNAAPKWASYALPASLTANTILVGTSTTAVGCTNVLPFTVGIEQGGTGATTEASARANLHIPRYFSQQITDWTTQDYTVTHNLGSSKALVQLYEQNSTDNTKWEKVDVGLTVTTNTIILSSAKAGIMSGKTLLVTAVLIEA